GLKQTGAAGGEFAQQRRRRRQIRVARRDERDEGLALALAQAAEEGIDGVHSFSPCSSATSKQSLSPRPEKQTTTTSSLPLLAATRMASTTACAVSSAGRMPSSREHCPKHARASASLTLV